MATLAELERDIECGCLQQMTLDPYAPSCGDSIFCINCASCDGHCQCSEPVTLADITEGMDA